MFRNLIYLLSLLFLNQVICANEGARLISTELSAITDAADSGDAYAQDSLPFVISMGIRDCPYPN